MTTHTHLVECGTADFEAKLQQSIALLQSGRITVTKVNFSSHV